VVGEQQAMSDDEIDPGQIRRFMSMNVRDRIALMHASTPAKELFESARDNATTKLRPAAGVTYEEFMKYMQQELRRYSKSGKKPANMAVVHRVMKDVHYVDNNGQTRIGTTLKKGSMCAKLQIVATNTSRTPLIVSLSDDAAAALSDVSRETVHVNHNGKQHEHRNCVAVVPQESDVDVCVFELTDDQITAALTPPMHTRFSSMVVHNFDEIMDTAADVHTTDGGVSDVELSFNAHDSEHRKKLLFSVKVLEELLTRKVEGSVASYDVYFLDGPLPSRNHFRVPVWLAKFMTELYTAFLNEKQNTLTPDVASQMLIVTPIVGSERVQCTFELRATVAKARMRDLTEEEEEEEEEHNTGDEQAGDVEY
jgi:hypothetical protein